MSILNPDPYFNIRYNDIERLEDELCTLKIEVIEKYEILEEKIKKNKNNINKEYRKLFRPFIGLAEKLDYPPFISELIITCRIWEITPWLLPDEHRKQGSVITMISELLKFPIDKTIQILRIYEAVMIKTHRTDLRELWDFMREKGELQAIEKIEKHHYYLKKSPYVL